jgi:CRP-like cAMP-binding protein
LDKFINYIKSVHPLSNQTVNKFCEILTEKRYFTKDLISEIGVTPKKISFLKSGIARLYMISPKGNEYNKAIFTSGDFIGSLSALIKNKPSIYTIECLTECTVFECDYTTFIALVETNNDLATLHRKNLEKQYITIYNRNLEFLTLDATQRYLNLRKKIPNIDTLIPQKQIANHLAITSIQLSRIRKKLQNS